MARGLARVACFSVILFLATAAAASAEARGGMKRCMKLKKDITKDIIGVLEKQNGLHIQNGQIQFNFLGDEEVLDCDEKNCAFTNPKSPYGLTTLPLAPEEDLEAKLKDKKAPDSVQSLDGPWGRGVSPIWQLRSDEVVMAIGCTPPASTSRYFSFTGYLYDLYDTEKNKWVSAFGSLGDSLSIYRDNSDNTSGVENRLATSARIDRKPLYSDREEAAFHRDAASAYDKLTVVLFGASQSSVGKIEKSVKQALAGHGLERIVNVIGIPQKFAETVGLDTFSSYYSLIARNIVADNNLEGFKQYAEQDPLVAWRLTPKAAAGALEATDMFPMPQVIPREAPIPSGESGEVQGNEDFLADALEELIARVEGHYNSSHVVAHAFGSDSSLGLVGIDYGLDCVERKLEYCNGDNRDAQYLTTYPLMLLNTVEKFSYVVGVNHRQAGASVYSNIAVSDPIQKLGVTSVDDAEMLGSAMEFLEGTQYEGVQDKLYAIKFARKCNGARYCTEIPFEGARKVPLDTQILLASRAYVNPITKVGPSASDLLMPHMMLFTPESTHTDKDVRERIDPEVVRNSVCMASFVGLTTCTSGLDGECCVAMSKWTKSGCFCDELGNQLLDTLPDNIGAKGLKRLSLICGAVPKPCKKG